MWPVVRVGALAATFLIAFYLRESLRLLPTLALHVDDLNLSPKMSDVVGFNGTGVYNSSWTPISLPWNTYNYCNAPHVAQDHYEALEGAELVYLNLMMRHHKVSIHPY